jgi:hypothetical protein
MILTITGHKTLAKVERYTRAAEQKRLAQSAMELLSQSLPAIRFPNLSGGFGETKERANDIKPEPASWRSLRESNPSFQIENLTS